MARSCVSTRPLFREREPGYVLFDVLNVEGADVRAMPLKDRRAILDRIAQRYGMQKSELFFGCGKSLFNVVCNFDLEGIIVKRLDDLLRLVTIIRWNIMITRNLH